MALAIAEIKEAVKKPSQNARMAKARLHQQRIKFHTECLVSPKETLAYRTFMDGVKQLLPRDKFQLFKQLFPFPIKTNEVTAEIFEQLSRVLNGRNPAYNYQFMDTEERDDWEYYRQEVLKEPQIWQETAWEWFKTEINSLVVVDLPVTQEGERPEPYFYWLRFSNVIDYKMDCTDPNNMRFEWIIFRDPKTKNIAVYDRFAFQIFEWDSRENNIGNQIVYAEHLLGYTPVFFFWSTPILLDEPEIKESPITKVLSSLDNYLFFSVSKDHLDLYAPYPVYSGYQQECDFRNTETGEYCDGGYLKDKDGNFRIVGANTPCKCPVCADRRVAGAGTYVEIPVPDPQNGQADLRNPITITTIDVASLNYNVDEEQRKRTRIIQTVVGVDNEAINDQAINELQVSSTFESRNTVLNQIKRNFEKIQNAVDETCARLRYGNDRVLAVNINWGTDFFLLSSGELRAQYVSAKDAGASEAELDTLKRQILETEYRNNPLELQRQIILSEIEPYSHYTRDEIINLSTRGMTEDLDVAVKLNFSNFVRRFERENMNVIEFGSLLPFDQKINIIINTLRDYAREKGSTALQRGANQSQTRGLPGDDEGNAE